MPWWRRWWQLPKRDSDPYSNRVVQPIPNVWAQIFSMVRVWQAFDCTNPWTSFPWKKKSMDKNSTVKFHGFTERTLRVVSSKDTYRKPCNSWSLERKYLISIFSSVDTRSSSSILYYENKLFQWTFMKTLLYKARKKNCFLFKTVLKVIAFKKWELEETKKEKKYMIKMGDIEISSLFWKCQENKYADVWSTPISYYVAIRFCSANLFFARQLKQLLPHTRVLISSLLNWLPPLASFPEFTGNSRLKPRTMQYWWRLIQSHTELDTGKSIIFFGRCFFHSLTRSVSSVN